MATKNNTKSNNKSNSKDSAKTSSAKTSSTTNSTNITPPWEEKVTAGSTNVNTTDYSGWNKDIENQANIWKKQGKDVYYAQDNNGAWHITTRGQDRAYEIADKYNTNSATPYNIGGKTYVVTPVSQTEADLAAAKQAGYDEAMSYYNNIYATQQAESNAALQKASEASKTAINTAYDDTARKYYQLYKTQNAKLPENLSLAGVTGGASESAQLNLLNTYANNLYNNESGRNTQLANVDQNYNDKVASNSISAANSIADAYLQLAQQKLAYDREDAQLAAEAQQTAEEQAAAQKLETRNANVRKRMLEQLNKGDTIWSWEDESGELHWTTYKAVAETYKSTYKVIELTTKDKDKVSSLGKKSTSTTTPSPSAVNNPFTTDDSGTAKDDYNTILNYAKIGVSSPITLEKTVEMINNSTLTQAQKNQIYKEVGLV